MKSLGDEKQNLLSKDQKIVQQYRGNIVVQEMDFLGKLK
jgi:hypothetical protein